VIAVSASRLVRPPYLWVCAAAYWQTKVNPVLFAELLDSLKREMGAVIRPFPAGKVSLEGLRALCPCDDHNGSDGAGVLLFIGRLTAALSDLDR
jgi:hypothetical protein